MEVKIRIIENKPEAFLDELSRRKAFDLEQVSAQVAGIISRVRDEGDQAVVEFTRRFDRVSLSPEQFRVSREEIEKASTALAPELKEALTAAYSRICDYHRRQCPESWFTTGPDGEILGQRVMPVESAAIYAPGGKAAYPSSVLMGVGAARTAGVKRIALFSPPDEHGGLNPAVLFAAGLAEVEEIYRSGLGARGIKKAMNKLRKIYGIS